MTCPCSLDVLLTSGAWLTHADLFGHGAHFERDVQPRRFRNLQDDAGHDVPLEAGELHGHGVLAGRQGRERVGAFLVGVRAVADVGRDVGRGDAPRLARPRRSGRSPYRSTWRGSSDRARAAPRTGTRTPRSRRARAKRLICMHRMRHLFRARNRPSAYQDGRHRASRVNAERVTTLRPWRANWSAATMRAKDGGVKVIAASSSE